MRADDFRFSTEELEALRLHVTKFTAFQCPVCGGRDFDAVGRGSIPMKRRSPGEGETHVYAPTAILACSKCFYIVTFGLNQVLAAAKGQP